MKNCIYFLFILLTFATTACEPVVCYDYTTSKAELSSKIAAKDLPNYEFAETETDDTILQSMTLRQANLDPRLLDAATLKSGLVTGWYIVKDKKTANKITFSSTLTETDSAFTFRIQNQTDHSTEDFTFAKLRPIKDIPPIDPKIPPFDPCLDPVCTQYYADHIFPSLIAQANLTCRRVGFCMSCPLINPCIFVLGYFEPTSWKCRKYTAQIYIKSFASLPREIPIRTASPDPTKF